MSNRDHVISAVYTDYHSRNDRKEIQLFQKEDLSMGFSIRGGLEHGCGIFVSEVLTSSKAAQAGLKVFKISYTVPVHTQIY